MSEESTYFGPEKAKYPHLERGDRPLQDLRADVDAAFLRVERAFSAVENTINDPVALGADPGDWKRYIVGAAPAGAFSTFDIGTIAIRKQSGVYTAADGSGWYNVVPVVGNVVLEKNAGTIQRCSSVGPPIVWTTTVGTTAATVSILDAAGYYALTTVEGALTELGTNIGGLTSSTYTFTTSGAPGYCTNNTAVYANLDAINEGIIDIKNTAAGEGASLVGLEATVYWDTSAEVQAALAAIGAQVGGLTESTFTFTTSGGAGYCTNDTPVYSNLDAINEGIIDIKNTAAGEGASLVGLEPTVYWDTSTNVQAALAAIGAQVGGLTEATFTFTTSGGAGYCTNDTAVYANIDAINEAIIDIKNTAAGEGASMIGLEPTGYWAVSTDVQTALEAVGTQIGGLTEATFTFAEANVCTNDTAVYANLNALDLKWGDLAAYVTGEGAQLIGVENATGYGTSQTAQDAFESLLEGYTPVPIQMLIVDEVGTLTPISAATTPGLAIIANTLNATWVAGNVDEAYFTIALDPRIDEASDAYIDLIGMMDGAGDTPTVTVTTDWSGAGPIVDVTDAFTAGAGVHTATVAAADIPAGASVLGVTLTPGAHGAQALLLTGIRFRYSKTYA